MKKINEKAVGSIFNPWPGLQRKRWFGHKVNRHGWPSSLQEHDRYGWITPKNEQSENN